LRRAQVLLKYRNSRGSSAQVDAGSIAQTLFWSSLASKSELFMNGIGICAVAIAGSFVFRLLAPASQTVGLNPLSPPVFVEDWTRLHEVGRTEGPDSAVLQIVEFTDFECPACARYERTLKGFLGRHEHEVRRTVIHWPLDIHPRLGRR
jgi:hypothetical protein